MNSRTSRSTKAVWLSSLVLMAALAGGEAHAGNTINLTNSDVPTGCKNNQCSPQVSSGVINGGIFLKDSTQPAGTGIFNPFLRLDVKGNNATEQGYNTNAVKAPDDNNPNTTRKVMDNMSPLNWTHDVNINSLNIVTVNNVEYFQFKLDINEPGNEASLLSLDGLRLIVGAGGQFGQATDAYGDLIIDGYNGTTGGINGQVVYDMDAGTGGKNDNFVMLDARLSGGPGSGIADMGFLAPVSAVAGAKVVANCVDTPTARCARENDGKNLILWSRFGLQEGMVADKTDGSFADAGFEEWSFGAKVGTPQNPPGPPPGVPTPGSAALALLGLAFLSRHRLRGLKRIATA